MRTILIELWKEAASIATNAREAYISRLTAVESDSRSHILGKATYVQIFLQSSDQSIVTLGRVLRPPGLTLVGHEQFGTLRQSSIGCRPLRYVGLLTIISRVLDTTKGRANTMRELCPQSGTYLRSCTRVI